MKVLILIACLLAFTMSFRLTAKTRQEGGHCADACDYLEDLLAKIGIPDNGNCEKECAEDEFGPDGEARSTYNLLVLAGGPEGIESINEFAELAGVPPPTPE